MRLLITLKLSQKLTGAAGAAEDDELAAAMAPERAAKEGRQNGADT